MIWDRTFDQQQLFDFFSQNADQFSSNLLEQIKKSGNGTLEQYTTKLSCKATIACEYDDSDQKMIKGLVIGYTHDLPDTNESYITYVIVSPDYRKQGVMKRLLNEYEAHCQKLGISAIWLTTGKINKVAQTAYEKCGFICQGEYSETTVKYTKTIQH